MRQFQRLLSLIRMPVYHKSSRVTAKTYNYHTPNVLCRFQYYSNKIDDKFDWDVDPDTEYQEVQEEFVGAIHAMHRIFVIQPFVKWGKKKKRNTNPELQLAEAVSLIETLPDWSVVGTKCIPVLNLSKIKIFGTGNLDTIKQLIQKSNPTAVFISTNLLKFGQVIELQKEFNVPVYDRYAIVIHIFRIHAMTPEAKLQVAIAELPYIRKKMHAFALTPNGDINVDRRKKEIIDRRAKLLEEALDKLEKRREHVKSRRMSLEIPSVAVVGYTNAGKTSLIKALTGDASLRPKNKLFATLDTTVHAGILPCQLEILYVDTIGFIQDVPEMLIKPFYVTLQDAFSADVIVHVFDISHPDAKGQVDHVFTTLQNLLQEKKSVIHVGNKCDLTIEPSFKTHMPEETFLVSAKKSIGTDLLKLKIEEEVLLSTNRKHTRVRVKLGSPEETWLYKRTTVVNVEPDPQRTEYNILEVIVTDVMLREFYTFLRTQK